MDAGLEGLSTEELYRQWESALDRSTAAELQDEADRRGFDLIDAARELRDGQGLTAANIFKSELHPRGRDGKFIDVWGLVNLFNFKGRDRSGNTVSYDNRRGRVKEIKGGFLGRNPSVTVELLDRNGRPSGETVDVKPRNIEAAPQPKAHLFREQGGGGFQRGRPAPGHVTGKPGDVTGPEQPEDVFPRGTRARPAPEGAGVGRERRPRPWTRPRRREGAPPEPEPPRTPYRAKSGDEQRQEITDRINAAIPYLDPINPEIRAEQLDELLGPMRFSVMGTDHKHDHLSAPETNGWTAERSAIHEEMWQEMLAAIEGAGIPKGHDALVLGGLPGSGKSSLLRPGGVAEKEYGVIAWEPENPIPAGATHVSINPDLIKDMLIKRGMLPEGIDPGLKPREQVTFLHEESSYLSKQWLTRLSDDGYNVVLDNTMDSPGATLKRMNPLARAGYNFRGLFADISSDESHASRMARYKRNFNDPLGGRFVSSSVTGNRGTHTGRYSKNRDAMDSLVGDDWFTDWMVVDNSGVVEGNPKGEVSARGGSLGTAAKWWTGDLSMVPRPPARRPRKPLRPLPKPERRSGRSGIGDLINKYDPDRPIRDTPPWATVNVTAPEPPSDDDWMDGWTTDGIPVSALAGSEPAAV